MAKPASPEAPPHPWLAGVPPRPHPAHRVAPSTARHAVLPPPPRASPCGSHGGWALSRLPGRGGKGRPPLPSPFSVQPGRGRWPGWSEGPCVHRAPAAWVTYAPCPGVTWAENQPGRPCLAAPNALGLPGPTSALGPAITQKALECPPPPSMPARPPGTGQSLPQARAARAGAGLSCTSHPLAVRAAVGRGHVAALLWAALRSRMLTSEFHELQPEGCGALMSHQLQP